MSEPALPSENARDLDQNESTAPTDRAGLVLVKEGYYKYTDILFDWHKHMNIWQVSLDGLTLLEMSHS